MINLSDQHETYLKLSCQHNPDELLTLAKYAYKNKLIDGYEYETMLNHVASSPNCSESLSDLVNYQYGKLKQIQQLHSQAITYFSGISLFFPKNEKSSARQNYSQQQMDQSVIDKLQGKLSNPSTFGKLLEYIDALSQVNSQACIDQALSMRQQYNSLEFLHSQVKIYLRKDLYTYTSNKDQHEPTLANNVGGILFENHQQRISFADRLIRLIDKNAGNFDLIEQLENGRKQFQLSAFNTMLSGFFPDAYVQRVYNLCQRYCHYFDTISARVSNHAITTNTR